MQSLPYPVRAAFHPQVNGPLLTMDAEKPATPCRDAAPESNKAAPPQPATSSHPSRCSSISQLHAGHLPDTAPQTCPFLLLAPPLLPLHSPQRPPHPHCPRPPQVTRPCKWPAPPECLCASPPNSSSQSRPHLVPVVPILCLNHPWEACSTSPAYSGRQQVHQWPPRVNLAK